MKFETKLETIGQKAGNPIRGRKVHEHPERQKRACGAALGSNNGVQDGTAVVLV